MEKHSNQKSFFNEGYTKRKLQTLRSYLIEIVADTEFEKQRNAHLSQIVHSMETDPSFWDTHCQTNIEWIGDNLLESITGKESGYSKEELDNIYSDFYRFILEAYFSTKNNFSRTIEEARQFARSKLSKFEKMARDQIIYAHMDMPINILKELARNEAVINLRNMDSVSNAATNKINDWNESLSKQETRVNNLKEKLDEYETAFNFVGLYKGFEQLLYEKREELKKLRFWTILVGLIAISPVLIKSTYLAITGKNIEFDFSSITTLLPLISLVCILIYYFRIFFMEYKSIKSQILQIELRKTLCQFIQSYSEYSKDIKAQDKSALERFERIVFSSIAPGDDNIPSAYDGIEQLVKLIKTSG